jgi:hypothetical protein
VEISQNTDRVWLIASDDRCSRCGYSETWPEAEAPTPSGTQITAPPDRHRAGFGRPFIPSSGDTTMLTKEPLIERLLALPGAIAAAELKLLDAENMKGQLQVHLTTAEDQLVLARVIDG